MAKVELPTVVACAASGVRIDAEQKAWVHECGSVLWGLRRWLQPVFHRRKVLDLSHVIRDNQHAFPEATLVASLQNPQLAGLLWLWLNRQSQIWFLRNGSAYTEVRET